MKRTLTGRIVLTCLSSALLLVAGDDSPTTVSVTGGSAAFTAKTNVPAVSVKGKSSALEARVKVQRGPEGLRLEQIEARLPVKSLMTGMNVRDEHMRKYIFTTKEGETPDVRFESRESSCKGNGSGETTCQVSGSLTIRGVAHAFSVPLKVRGDGSTFRASGEAAVKLSDYGIDQPTQFGVKTLDEVQLHFDFTARQSKDVVASAGALR